MFKVQTIKRERSYGSIIILSADKILPTVCECFSFLAEMQFSRAKQKWQGVKNLTSAQIFAHPVADQHPKLLFLPCKAKDYFLN